MRTISEQIIEQMYYANDAVEERNLKFPKSPKSYFDDFCDDEWKRTSVEDKLLDLGYLVTHGFDLEKYIIDDYIPNHLHSESYILDTFIYFISYFRTQGGYYDFGMAVLETNDKITISEAVHLFCKEIKSRYEQRETYPQGLYSPRFLEQQLKTMPAWDYQLLANLKLTKEQYYNIFKMSTEEYLRIINTL